MVREEIWKFVLYIVGQYTLLSQRIQNFIHIPYTVKAKVTEFFSNYENLADKPLILLTGEDTIDQIIVRGQWLSGRLDNR